MDNRADRLPAECCLIADFEGRIRFLSEALGRRLGISQATAVGRRLEDVLPGAAQAETFSGDGLVEFRQVPMPDGEPACVCLLREISRFKLEEVAKLTHDLNNVFTVIYAALEIASHERDLSGELLKSMRNTQQSARRGAQIVAMLRQSIGREPREEAAISEAENRAIYVPPHGKEQVLVISTSRTQRLLLRAILSYRGYQVTEADAMETARPRLDQPPALDLLIVDDATLLDTWRQEFSKIPLILVGGEAQPASDESEPERLKTPVDSDVLLAAVRRVLDRRTKSKGN